VTNNTTSTAQHPLLRCYEFHHVQLYTEHSLLWPNPAISHTTPSLSLLQAILFLLARSARTKSILRSAHHTLHMVLDPTCTLARLLALTTTRESYNSCCALVTGRSVPLQRHATASCSPVGSATGPRRNGSCAFPIQVLLVGSASAAGRGSARLWHGRGDLRQRGRAARQRCQRGGVARQRCLPRMPPGHLAYS